MINNELDKKKLFFYLKFSYHLFRKKYIFYKIE